MRFLLSALALFAPFSSAYAADQDSREVAYARCVMQSFEHAVVDKTANEIYVVACMRVAGYVHENGGLRGSSQYAPASGG
jgi:hypothetical protein